jgi:hypothetical protein
MLCLPFGVDRVGVVWSLDTMPSNGPRKSTGR